MAFSSQFCIHEYFNTERHRDIASYKNLQSRPSMHGDTAHAGPFVDRLFVIAHGHVPLIAWSTGPVRSIAIWTAGPVQSANQRLPYCFAWDGGGYSVAWVRNYHLKIRSFKNQFVRIFRLSYRMGGEAISTGFFQGSSKCIEYNSAAKRY